MTAPAPSLEERLRALGPERARKILAEIEAAYGRAGVASLLFNPRVYLRPKQMPRGPYRTLEVFTGERRVGKSHAARELFRRLLPRAARARIMVAVDDAVAVTVWGGESGFKPSDGEKGSKARQWTPPWVRCEFREKPYAGTITLGDREIVCCSAAGGGNVGPGWGLTWADDPAAWVKALGEKRAKAAWIDMLKSNSAPPGITVVSTTGMGISFIWNLIHEAHVSEDAVRIHDLGVVENNASNLSRNYIEHIVPGLRADGTWDEDADPTGAFAEIDFERLRVVRAPELRELAVVLDPAKSSRSKSCEVGLVAMGIDGRSTVYALADRSKIMSAAEWPRAAHDLLEEIQGAFPGVPVRFVIENNAGGEMGAELLRAEERRRRLEAGGRGVSVIEIREKTARPNDSKVRRAGPVVALAKSGQLRHVQGLGVLEGQLQKLTDAAPGNDRADAEVWGALDLAGLGDEKEARKERERVLGAEATRRAFQGLDEAQRSLPRVAFDLERA